MLDVQPPKTAVIVEDDPDVRHLLSEVLESAGFSTVSVGNGIDGVRAVANYQPLITTLDVNMPGIDGFEAARRIRAQSDTYIIMLTALDDEVDVVLGLNAGADEYLNKPFRPRELRARIEALLRRPRTTGTPSRPQQEQSGPSFPAHGTPSPAHQPAYQAQPSYQPQPAHQPAPAHQPQPSYQLTPGDQTAPPIIPVAMRVPGREIAPLDDGGPVAELSDSAWVAHRDLQLNPETRIVRVQEHEVDLTRTEFDLLCALMESKRRVRSKADLTLVLRGESYVTSYFVGDADKRAVEAHMTNLRRKLGDSASQPRYIETVRGVGYRLTSALAA